MELSEDMIDNKNIKHEEVTEEFIENDYCEIPICIPIPLKVESNNYARIRVSVLKLSSIYLCI